MESCSFTLINSGLPTKEICDIVRSSCEFSYFNLLTLNFCYWHDYRWVTLILVLFILLLCFYFLSSTGSDYLAPAWGIISEKLNLSQNLAGLTLLALGNQAPDVVVAIVAGGEEDAGIETSLGAIFGAGMIVVGLVLSSVIFLGNEVNVMAGNYIRDLLIYLLSICLLLWYGYQGKIDLLRGSGFFLLYIIYVIICFLMDSQKKKEIENCDNEKYLGDNDENANHNQDYSIKLFRATWKTLINPTDEEEPKDTSYDNSGNVEITKCDLTQKSFNWEDIVQKSFYYRKSRLNKSGINRSESYIAKEIEIYSKFHYDLVRSYWNTSEVKWIDMSTRQKIWFIIVDFPLNIIRDLTIPAYELQKWKRGMFIALPISLSVFLIVIFHLYSLFIDFPIYIGMYFLLMTLTSLVFFMISYRTSLPKCWWVLLISAFVISILWIWSITNILMDMIEVVHLLLPVEIPQSFLSMTILALGNSLPDFIVNCSLAKTGFAEMAWSGSIGAPVFGILFGFGASVMKRIITLQKDVEFKWFDLHVASNRILLIAIATIVILIFERLLLGVFMGFQLKKFASIGGYLIYTAYFSCIVYFTFFFKG